VIKPLRCDVMGHKANLSKMKEAAGGRYVFLYALEACGVICGLRQA
jgi:hypothetical protein